MIYKPRKDLLYAFSIWLGPLIILIFLIFSFSEKLLIVFSLSLLLSFWIWNSVYYKIENGELLMKVWILKKKVKIKDITELKKTTGLYSSYALSYERLEITVKLINKIYVAPKDFETFSKDLLKQNPTIKMN
jgi:hypothetical protein